MCSIVECTLRKSSVSNHSTYLTSDLYWIWIYSDHWVLLPWSTAPHRCEGSSFWSHNAGGTRFMWYSIMLHALIYLLALLKVKKLSGLAVWIPLPTALNMISSNWGRLILVSRACIQMHVLRAPCWLLISANLFHKLHVWLYCPLSGYDLTRELLRSWKKAIENVLYLT